MTEVADLGVLLALHLQQLADSLLVVRAGVHDAGVGLERPAEDAEEVDAAGEGVGDGLEDECGGAAADVDRRLLLGRRGDALDQQVEECGRAEVLGGDPAGDREELAARDRVLERVRHLVRRQLLAVEVALHEALVRLHHRVEQLLAVLGDLVGQLVRDRPRLGLVLALGARVRGHVQEVDDPRQLMLGADRQMDRDALGGELRLERLESPEEARALTVEHVHEEDAGEAELVRALPDAARVHLHTHDAAQDDQRALDDAHRRDRVPLKARVARSVDQVDLAVLPVRMRHGGGQGHTALVLVVVPVGHRRASLDRAEPVHGTALEEHRLDERGLSGAAMAGDDDISDLGGVGYGHSALLGVFGGICR